MTIEQLKKLKGRLAVIRRYLDVDQRLRDIEEKKQLSMNPDFWNQPEAAKGVLKSLKIDENWVNTYTQVETQVEDLEVLYEFLKEGESSEEEVDQHYQDCLDAIEELEFKSTLNQEEDELDCILEINAGAGGTESCDWAEMLLRMYTMWAEKNGYKWKGLHRVDGDVAGIKSSSIEINGNFAYGYLKGENGVHRLVRISPFNAQGKRQTSFASIFVHPMIDDSIEIEVNSADLDWDTFRSSGAGGQHVNKTESAVRLRHLPSGIVVECQQERSQHLNREKAIKMLKSRLYELEIERKNAERDKVEAGKTKIEWGAQIRSYVLDDRRVKDHRSNHLTNNTDAVLDGDLNPFIKAFLMMGKTD
ncbi:MAG: peptide chain release factor 2 [Bacteroidota bacterium]